MGPGWGALLTLLHGPQSEDPWAGRCESDVESGVGLAQLTSGSISPAVATLQTRTNKRVRSKARRFFKLFVMQQKPTGAKSLGESLTLWSSHFFMNKIERLIPTLEGRRED